MFSCNGVHCAFAALPRVVVGLLLAVPAFLAAAAREPVVFLAVARAVVVFLTVVLPVGFLAAVVVAGSIVDTPSSLFLRVAVLRVVFGVDEWFSPATATVFRRAVYLGKVPSAWGLVSSVRGVAIYSA